MDAPRLNSLKEVEGQTQGEEEHVEKEGAAQKQPGGARAPGMSTFRYKHQGLHDILIIRIRDV